MKDRVKHFRHRTQLEQLEKCGNIGGGHSETSVQFREEGKCHCLFFYPDFLLQQNKYADVYVYVSRDKDLVMHSSVTYTFTFTSVHTRTMMVTVMVMVIGDDDGDSNCDVLVTVVVKVMGIDEIHKIHYLPMYLPGHVESTHPSLHTEPCSMK